MIYWSIRTKEDEQAKIAYPKWEKEEFNSTQKWIGADFIPSDPQDDYRFEGVQVLSDKSIISCSYLQRHQKFIAYVLVTFDDDIVTFAKLNNILKIIDDRLNQVILE